MNDHITVKGDEASVIYRYTRDEPATVVAGVPARDLTGFDLAAMSPDQRITVKFLADADGGAYERVGDIPKGLSFEPPPGPIDLTPVIEPGTDLAGMTRSDLNTYAADRGIETPESFATKGDLIAAIEAIAAGNGG